MLDQQLIERIQRRATKPITALATYMINLILSPCQIMLAIIAIPSSRGDPISTLTQQLSDQVF